MSTLSIVLIVILCVLVAVLIILYFLGKRLQKRQAAQEEQMEAVKQTVSMLVIDKKMMPLKESGLPQAVIDQTPKIARRQKLPIVKAKVGPRIMTLVADTKVYDLIPVKKEIKAVVSGIYIMDVKGIRGNLETPPKKQGFWKRLRNRVTKAADEGVKEEKEKNAKKSGKSKQSGKSSK